MPRSLKGSLFTLRHGRGRRSAILDSARNNEVDTLRQALTSGGDVNARTRPTENVPDQQRQATALIVAARRNHLPIVQTLLDRGADIHATNRAGDTALMLAARNGHAPLIELLLRNGTRVNDQNGAGDTPIILAARNGHYDAAKLLVLHGADPTIRNHLHRDAFAEAHSTHHRHSARRRLFNMMHVAHDPYRALSRYSYEPRDYDGRGMYTLRLRLAEQLGIDLNRPNQQGYTLPMLAAKWGNYRNLLEMLKSGKVHDVQKLKNILQRKSDQIDRSDPFLDPLLIECLKLIQYIQSTMRAGHLLQHWAQQDARTRFSEQRQNTPTTAERRESAFHQQPQREHQDRLHTAAAIRGGGQGGVDQTKTGENLVSRVAQSVSKIQNPALRHELMGFIAPVDQVLAPNSPYVKQMTHRRGSQTSK